MMRSTAPMRSAKIGYIVLSILICALGILLIAFPSFSVSLLGWVSGGLLVLFGIVKLIGYFSKDLYRLAFQYDLAFGILLLALGTVILVHPGSVMNFICIALGIVILADGLFKIQISTQARQFGLRKWWLILLFAVAACLCGAALLFRPAEGSRVLTILLGISLLAEGILNFATILMAVKIIKHQQPDVIEIHTYTEKEDM